MLSNNISLYILKYWAKNAFLPRLVCIIIATIVLANWLESNNLAENFFIAIQYSLIVSFSLYIGSTLKLIYKIGSPSWTYGFFLSLFVFVLLLFALNPKSVTYYGFPFGIFINIAYLGAKIGCMKIGCCGIKSIKDRHLYGWKLRPRLQTFEIVVTITIIFLGMITYLFGNHQLSGLTLLIGHGFLRMFAGLYRFPYKTIKIFFKEASGGGIVLVGILSMVVPEFTL